MSRSGVYRWILVEATDLVMGMRRGPSRVAPHNVLKAYPTGCAFLVSCSLFMREQPFAQHPDGRHARVSFDTPMRAPSSR